MSLLGTSEPAVAGWRMWESVVKEVSNYYTKDTKYYLRVSSLGQIAASRGS